MKNQEKVKFNPLETVYCEISSKNNGNPFEVSVKEISDSGKTALVSTTSGHNLEFRTSVKNLYNAIVFNN